MSERSLYTYEGTEVLKNKFDIRDQKELDEFERLITTAKVAELELKPIKGDFDLEHLQKIHKHIFGDIYEFAGKIRQENIAKDYFSFADARFIVPGSNDLFGQLKQENHLKGMKMNEFSPKAAHYLAEINVLHPFREGNGRSQREFIRSLAKEAGFKIEWSKAPKKELLEAMIKSHVNIESLGRVIGSITTPIKEGSSKSLVQQKQFDLER